MKEGKSLRIGVLGASLSALACFTPLVITALGLAGLSSWFTWLDSAFHGILAICLAIAGFATYRTWRMRKKREVSSRA